MEEALGVQLVEVGEEAVSEPSVVKLWQADGLLRACRSQHLQCERLGEG